MEIRRILAYFELDRFSPALAASAANLAERFGAEVIGFSAAVPSPVFVGVHGAVAAASVYAEQRIEMEAELERMRDKFLTAMPPSVSGTWRQMVETPNRAVVEMGRAVDLIVAVAPNEPNPSRLRTLDIGDLVLSVGRPVLLVQAGVTEVRAEKIVVGWKDSREARRAMVDALPFLKSAEAVKICAIEEGDFASAKASLDDALGWLQSHDVKASGEMVPRAYEGLSATLDNVRRNFGADLLVTGAYGHSRLREWFLGGITRDLIEVPVSNHLMSN